MLKRKNRKDLFSSGFKKKKKITKKKKKRTKKVKFFITRWMVERRTSKNKGLQHGSFNRKYQKSFQSSYIFEKLMDECF